MRFFDLILAIAVLAALLFVARHQFSAYDGKSFGAPSAADASPSEPVANPTPASS